MILFALFIAIPLIEIALFIQVGGMLGLATTLLIVVITAILGSFLLRRQGVMAINSLQQRLSTFQDPSEPLAHGAMILFAGVLLLTPGFFTDALGLSLMIPAVRQFAFAKLRKRMKMSSFEFQTTPPQSPHKDDVIDGDFEELPRNQRPTHSPSGWTKH